MDLSDFHARRLIAVTTLLSGGVVRTSHGAIRGVLRVGAGRGFIVDSHPFHRLVITAAHCLPFMPRPFGMSSTRDRTFANLLGHISAVAEDLVWAECMFVDPIADIAVLCAPDSASLPDEAKAYEALTRSHAALGVDFTGAESGEMPVDLLTLSGRVIRCVASLCGPALWLDELDASIPDGTPGSPVLTANGAVLAVLADPIAHKPHGPHARLSHCLPLWLCNAIQNGQRSLRIGGS